MSNGPALFSLRPWLSQQPPASHVVIAASRGISGAGPTGPTCGAAMLRGTSITGAATEIGG